MPLLCHMLSRTARRSGGMWNRSLLYSGPRVSVTRSTMAATRLILTPTFRFVAVLPGLSGLPFSDNCVCWLLPLQVQSVVATPSAVHVRRYHCMLLKACIYHLLPFQLLLSEPSGAFHDIVCCAVSHPTSCLIVLPSTSLRCRARTPQRWQLACIISYWHHAPGRPTYQEHRLCSSPFLALWSQ